MRWITVSYLAVLLCCQREDDSEGKFMTLQQEYPEASKLFAPSLMEKIHADSWTIAYGFYDNEGTDSEGKDFEPCASDYKKHHNIVEQQIKIALLKWLSPLTDDAVDIVDGKKLITGSGFRFITPPITETKKLGEHSLREDGEFILTQQQKPDLGIIFYCGMNQDSPISSSMDPEAHTKEGFMLVRMFPYAKKWIERKYNNPELDTEAFLTPNRKYRKFTLLHEFGHTMGLSDTYGGDMTIGDDDEPISTGGNRVTRGSQPLSVMSASIFYKVMGFPNNVELTLDDREGIKWLYAYHYKRQSLTSCPKGYKFEERDVSYTTKETTVCICPAEEDCSHCSEKVKEIKGEINIVHGCVPLHPIIFSVKQGNLPVIKDILTNDPEIDIDQQDELGNTALHYSVLYEKRHGHGGICSYLLNRGANCRVENDKKQTPYDLYSTSNCLNNFRASCLGN